MPLINAAELVQFSNALFVSAGVSPEASEIVSRSLVDANLRGHDSHGVMRIQSYVDAIQQGRVNPAATLTVVNETPAALTCDGGWGLGQVLMHDLMTRLVTKAGTLGVACGTVRRTAHIGRLGEYAEYAAEQGMSAIICANGNGAAQRVAPVGGKRPRLSTNPLCIGMPGGKEGPFVLDFGTSATAEGKVRVKKIAGQPVPLGWILDSEGHPTTDPNTLYGNPPGTILPMGGDQAYKGFGLAFMIEMLAGGLSGGQCVFPNPPPPLGNCVTVIVLAPQHLGGAAHLAKEVAQLETYVREVPLLDGATGITLPGDPERSVFAKRSREGITLDDGNWTALVKLAEKLGVTAPQLA